MLRNVLVAHDAGLQEPLQLSSSVNTDDTDDYDYIRKSFSKEWGMFDYQSDKTWGWTLDQRKAVFLGDVALTADDVRGKIMLDAGCGNGTMTAALSTLGMEVVGLDLNDRLGDANRYKRQFAGDYADNVHFVQGNLIEPPFQLGTFDLIYSSGVIHHTPSSKMTFSKLVPLLKRGGRLYVWVYKKRALPVRIFMDSGRHLKRFMSLESLLSTCRAVAPIYKIGTETLDRLHLSRFRKRTTREIALDLFDAWAPQYNHTHTEVEVQGWFKEFGFVNATVSGRQKHGFGVYGDKL